MKVMKIMSVIKRFAPELLMVSGTAGLVGTVILAVKTSWKIENTTEDVICYLREDIPHETPVKKTIYACKKLAPVYLPLAAAGGATLACFYAAHGLNIKRLTEVTSAYSLLATTFDKYKDYVADRFGATAKDIMNDLVDEEETNEVSETSVFWEGNGDVKVLDRTTGRKFFSSPAQLREAESKMMHLLLEDATVSVNEFYNELGLNTYNRIGDAIGWDLDTCPPDFTFRGGVDTDGELYLILIYDTRVICPTALKRL